MKYTITKQLMQYYQAMKVFAFMSKIKNFPSNYSVRFPGCPSLPGTNAKRAKRKQARQSRKINRN